MPIKLTRDQLRANFLRKVAKTDGCWNWLGGTFKSTGYGRYRVYGVKHQIPTHRVAWILFVGPIPAGLWVLHHCDNRLCVRPDHLFLGTNCDNIQDMIRKGRAWFQQGARP